jgi:hypothetical protein
MLLKQQQPLSMTTPTLMLRPKLPQREDLVPDGGSSPSPSSEEPSEELSTTRRDKPKRREVSKNQSKLFLSEILMLTVLTLNTD